MRVPAGGDQIMRWCPLSAVAGDRGLASKRWQHQEEQCGIADLAMPSAPTEEAWISEILEPGRRPSEAKDGGIPWRGESPKRDDAEMIRSQGKG